ncbi:MAG: hypothetical protein ACRD8W_02480, partial [Nitrososphaeraceae archaeon]
FSYVSNAKNYISFSRLKIVTMDISPDAKINNRRQRFPGEFGGHACVYIAHHHKTLLRIGRPTLWPVCGTSGTHITTCLKQ